jgi:hypothetical protein
MPSLRGSTVPEYALLPAISSLRARRRRADSLVGRGLSTVIGAPLARRSRAALFLTISLAFPNGGTYRDRDDDRDHDHVADDQADDDQADDE